MDPAPVTVPVEIFSRWDLTRVLFRAEVDASIPACFRIRAAVQVAVRTRADLTDANLTRADLTDADLTRANLTDANLTDADLTRANLTRANLTDADLTRANLTGVRNDLWDVLLRAIPEVTGLLLALREGRVDGSTYTGPCACLVGTIANVRGVDHRTLDYRNPYRPAERWFLAIRRGDTPANSPIAKKTEGWLVEFLALISAGTQNHQVSA